ncbi:rhamnan synthesis F family protein, partial [uncultured Enterovirga sp.]|uniref:rhamnan synthesis F family protein n=1 Tax=uncultured Enterovirga sp. TaxID=2026352 RepID=UPI0035CA82AB
MNNPHHYLVWGAARGLNPHPLFSTRWYLRKYPDIAEHGENPLVHYVKHGSKEKRTPGPLLSTDWYLKKLRDERSNGMNPLAYYLLHGQFRHDSPTPLFNPDWYIATYPEVSASRLDPFMHFMKIGMREGKNPNPFFDAQWYLKDNPDVVGTKQLAFAHYVEYGAQEGRNPGPYFDGDWYRKKYPDVRAYVHDPLSHYLELGSYENRDAIDVVGQKIAVVAHVFYLDMLPQVLRSLKNISIGFDLFVTTPEDQADFVGRRIRRAYPRARVYPVGNAGRDIGPFLHVMREISEDPDYLAICKIHTKKGTTEPDVWRHLLLESVLGSRQLVSHIIRTFSEEPNLDMVGPRDLYLSGWKFIGENGATLSSMIESLYPGRPALFEWGFFAGTMFWFRPRLFRNLLHHPADSLSAAETGASDGETAHSLERLFGFLAAQEARRVGLVSHSGHVANGYELRTQVAGTWTQDDPPHLYLARMARELEGEVLVPSAPSVRPRWTPRPGSRPGVRLIGPLTFLNGLSISTNGYLKAIQATGWRTSANAWMAGFERLKRIDAQVPADTPQPIQVVHLNLDLLASTLDNDPALLRTIWGGEGTYDVLICYFELASLKPEWLPVLDRFDEVWCASSFIQRAIEAASKVPVRIVRPNFSALRSRPETDHRSHFGLPRDRFVFAYIADAGSVLDRKNPAAFVETYLEAFGEEDGACCFVKIHYGSLDHPEIVRIRQAAGRRSDVVFSTDLYSDTEMGSLFGLIDCYVSPHRTEGLGQTIIEAMNAGKPVIATDYGGSTDFVTPTTAIPLPYRLIEVGDGNEPYPASFVWAEPDRAALRDGMRRIFSDQEAARTLGAAGRAHIQSLFSLEATSAAVELALNRIWEDAVTAPKGAKDRPLWRVVTVAGEKARPRVTTQRASTPGEPVHPTRGAHLSILVPVFNTPPDVLEEAIQSVLLQTSPRWELCICDDSSTDPAITDL